MSDAVDGSMFTDRPHEPVAASCGSGTRGVQSRMNPARPDLSDPIPGPKQFPRPKLEGPPARAVPWLVVQGPRGLSQRGGADESAAALEPVQDGAGGGGVIGLQAGTHLPHLFGKFLEEEPAQLPHGLGIAGQGGKGGTVVPGGQGEAIAYGVTQQPAAHRFVQHRAEAGRTQGIGQTRALVGSQRQRRRAVALIAQAGQQFAAVAVRQADVEQPERMPTRTGHVRRLGDGAGAVDRQVQRHQGLAQELTADRIILEQKQACVHRCACVMALPGTMLASMRRPAIVGKTRSLCLVALLAALLPALPTQARELRLQVEAVRSEAARLSGVQARLRWADDGEGGELELQADHLDAPLLAFEARQLAWRCPLARDGEGSWTCAGPVSLAGRERAGLQVALSPAALDAVLGSGAARIGVHTVAGAPGNVRVQLEKLPVAWMQGFLSGLWADGRWSSGRVDGRLDIGMGEASTVAAELRLDDIGLDTPGGMLAAAGVGGDLALDLHRQGSDTRLQARLKLRGGEFLAGSLYVPLPARGAEAELQAEQRGNGPWRLPKLRWSDPGVLEVGGQVALDGEAGLDELRLSLRIADLATARDRYLSGFLAPAGFPDLVLAGALGAEVSIEDARLTRLDLEVDMLNAVDPRQRFVLSGLDGSLRWHAGEEPLASRLAWRSAALYGIGLGPAEFGLSSRERILGLVEATRADTLGGHITLEHLRWQPPEGGQGTRFQLGVRLDDLDMGSLSQRLGWPPFTGSLGGSIPSARYADGVLTLDGGLAMQVFQGRLELSDLVMERPFGVAPTLSANVEIEDVDMEPMTAAFGFGAITGRLDGYIRDLRMVDWSPVAFDAYLRSDDGWKGKRRISQRAVEDISKVGGTGLMGSLQAQALRLFDDFGYARLALGCRLHDNVCQMSGVDSAGDGYTIVQGAGLPRIQVVGFRRRVDWPTLVARLKAVTEGQAPVIQ